MFAFCLWFADTYIHTPPAFNFGCDQEIHWKTEIKTEIKRIFADAAVCIIGECARGMPEYAHPIESLAKSTPNDNARYALANPMFCIFVTSLCMYYSLVDKVPCSKLTGEQDCQKKTKPIPLWLCHSTNGCLTNTCCNNVCYCLCVFKNVFIAIDHNYRMPNSL